MADEARPDPASSPTIDASSTRQCGSNVPGLHPSDVASSIVAMARRRSVLAARRSPSPLRARDHSRMAHASGSFPAASTATTRSQNPTALAA